MTMQQADMGNGKYMDVFIGGWKPQMNDPRDETFRLKLPREVLGSKQPWWDNRDICSAIENQKELGACTANAFAALVESNEIRRGASKIEVINSPIVTVSGAKISSDGSVVFQTTVKPSTPKQGKAKIATASKKLIDVARMFHYLATRKIMGTVNQDSGATIRDTIKAGAKYGVVDEKLWPYDITKFKTNPPDSVWKEAAKHKVTSYHAISDGDIETMKGTLLSGLLIEFGFLVYDYMLSSKMAKKGILCRPDMSKESQQGGHAVALVGYDDRMGMPDGSKGAFLVRNSWGAKWALGGYFWMAYNYVQDPTLCSDFWTVKSSPL